MWLLRFLVCDALLVTFFWSRDGRGPILCFFYGYILTIFRMFYGVASQLRSPYLTVLPRFNVFSCIPTFTDWKRPELVAKRFISAEMGRHAWRDGARDQIDHENDMWKSSCGFWTRRQYVPHRGDCCSGMERSNDQLRKYNIMMVKTEVYTLPL